MTQEEKQLLLKDLCTRLPYHDLWVQYDNKDWLAIGYGHGRIELLPNPFSSIAGPCPLIEDIKLYLRPMSSMTDEEKEKLQLLHDTVCDENYGDGYSPAAWDAIVEWEDYYNSNHLDYRGLIPMGLALKAKEGMYKISNHGKE